LGLHFGSAHTRTSGHLVFLRGHTFSVLLCVLDKFSRGEFLDVAHVWDVLSWYTFSTTLISILLNRFESLWTCRADWSVDLYLRSFACFDTWISNQFTFKLLTSVRPFLASTIVFAIVVTGWAH